IKQFRILTYVGDMSETQDCFYLEKLALPEDIQSMVVSRFFNVNVDTLVLDKSSFLSVYHYNDEEISCDFVNNICVQKEVQCLHKSAQPKRKGPLFLLNGRKFLSHATGSLQEAIQHPMNT
ncbi:MAG: hypothetical protein EZS28_038114, partial [Streblomastix strix]